MDDEEGREVNGMRYPSLPPDPNGGPSASEWIATALGTAVAVYAYLVTRFGL